jgi:tetratricopeptide (TPR) repeat protein
MAQILDRIERQLSLEVEPVARAVLIARKGIYLSRVGRFDEARCVIAELRSHFGSGQSARVTVWIMLLEGVCYLYENINPAAIDRVNRAQFLGLATKDKALISITSAWKAHLEFENSNYIGMVEALKAAIENATEDDNDANARYSMVLADALFFCGDRKLAQLWFMRSRDHAIKAGDQATIEALLYNRAAFSIAWLRCERCFSRVDPNEVSLVRLEVSSARNFQAMTKITAFGNLISLCDARLLIIESQFASAIAALELVRNSGPFASYNFDQDIVDLEVAYCQLMLGRSDEALKTFSKIRGNDLSGLDLDDRLVVAWLRSEMSRLDVRFGDNTEQTRRLEVLRGDYSVFRSDLQSLLAQFTTP